MDSRPRTAFHSGAESSVVVARDRGGGDSPPYDARRNDVRRNDAGASTQGASTQGASLHSPSCISARRRTPQFTGGGLRNIAAKAGAPTHGLAYRDRIEAGVFRINLELRTHNDQARAFYESLGFASEACAGYYQAARRATHVA